MHTIPLTLVRNKGRLLVLLILLVPALAVICHEAFLPHRITWANDSPLGQIKSVSARLPGTFTGQWGTNYWVGAEIPGSSPTVSTLLATAVSPEIYLKIFAPFTMLLLGFCAWLLFRQLQFSPMACVLGGVAAGLNMHFFSVACWGLGTWNVCCAMIFLAFAALVTPAIRQTYIKAALAGLAVGMSVMEGFDSGAILSVYVGVFILVWGLTTERSVAHGFLKSVSVGLVVVFFSVFIAASTLSTLVGTQIKGIAGMGQSVEDKKAHWDEATLWSVPKLESLRILIPGLFGYRMIDYTTSPDKSGVYWGNIAEHPLLVDLESSDQRLRLRAATSLNAPSEVCQALLSSDPKIQSQARDQIISHNGLLQRRHSGNGEYAGVLIALMAFFALSNSFRKGGGLYSVNERRLVWFFGAAALFSLVAAWGRYGPLYALLYKLPYFSVIRNPLKFMHPFQITWIILAGFGFEALSRSCFPAKSNRREAFPSRPAGWWRSVGVFERNWLIALGLALAASTAAYAIVRASRSGIMDYLEARGFGPDLAPQIASFSAREIGWYVLFLAILAAAIFLMVRGNWRTQRSAWIWTFVLGAVMAFDLGRADGPWVRYFDYQEKYAMNPIVDFLRQKPYEYRVAAKLTPRDNNYMLASPDQNLGQVCHWWLENDFPYNNIQSIDIDQMPRAPVWDFNYLTAFMPKSLEDLTAPVRLWQLTNTRYVLMGAGWANYLNERGDPSGHGFRIRALFDMALKPNAAQLEDLGDVTPQLNNSGPDALVELTDALPRAKLFSHWKTLPDNEALQTLAAPSFDFNQTVLVDKDTPAPQQAGTLAAEAGTVAISSYKPKDIRLKADAKAPSVLLFNERTAPSWRVSVDGKPAPLLRCNYLMRGVFVPPGLHDVEFQFKESLGPLCISLCAFAVGVLLIGYLVWRGGPIVAPARL